MGLQVAICRCGCRSWAGAWGGDVWAILGELMAKKKPLLRGCGAVAGLVGGHRLVSMPCSLAATTARCCVSVTCFIYVAIPLMERPIIVAMSLIFAWLSTS